MEGLSWINFAGETYTSRRVPRLVNAAVLGHIRAAGEVAEWLKAAVC